MEQKQDAFIYLESTELWEWWVSVPEWMPIRARKMASGLCLILNLDTFSRIDKDMRAICRTCSEPFRTGSPDTTI